MAASRYRIVLRGKISENFESAFDGMTLEHGPNRTVLTGDVRDQAQLYGLIGLLQEFGIELLAVEPLGGSDSGSGPGADPVASGLHVCRPVWMKGPAQPPPEAAAAGVPRLASAVIMGSPGAMYSHCATRHGDHPGVPTAPRDLAHTAL